MSTQPEALQLAKELTTAVRQSFEDEQVILVARWFVEDAAAELRRLHEVNTELLSELKNLRRAYVSLLETGRDRIIQYGGQCDSVESMEAADPNLKSACAAIAKATGEQA